MRFYLGHRFGPLWTGISFRPRYRRFRWTPRDRNLGRDLIAVAGMAALILAVMFGHR